MPCGLLELRSTGYRIHLVFLWLPTADEAVARVEERVRAGGHDVPEPTIRRRYKAGLKNLLQLYLPLADTWQVIDNRDVEVSCCVAAGGTKGPARVHYPLTWQSILSAVQTP